MSWRWFRPNFQLESSCDLYYKRATSNTEVSYLKTIFMSGRWFRPNFLVESFSRSLIQESHNNYRIELSGDHFHEWAMISSKFSCRDFLEIFNTKEPHHSQKWAIWRPFSWVGDDFVQIFMSRLLEIFNTREPQQLQNWAIWRPFSWVGVDFVQIFNSRVSCDLYYKRATSNTEVSYLKTIFMSGRWFRPNFLVESFSRSLIQENHIIHRSELSEDHFHEWAMISSKLSSREFLEIYNTREPHLSQKWAIWRAFSWVGVDFVQFFNSSFLRSIRQESHINHRSEIPGDNFHEWAMTSSKFFIVESFLRSIRQESHIIHRSELSGDHFHEWAMISSKFSCRDFLEIFNTREPHHSQKWAIWRPFSWVGDDFIQIFMSRFLEIFITREPQQLQNWAIWRPFSWVGVDFVQIFNSRVSCDLYYKRATSNTEVSYLKTIFMSGRWFRPNFLVERFSRSLIQENHIIHRSELSEDHFHEWAMISSNFSCRDFLRSSNTREPQQLQNWAIWRPFSWVGVDFVQIFNSRVSCDLYYKRATSNTEVSYLKTIFMSGRWFRPNFLVESFSRSLIQENHIIHRSELSEDHFHEWAMISSKLSSREFLEIFNTREPHHSQKWAIWRPFSWVGVQFFMSRFLEIFNTREPQQLQNWAVFHVGDDFVEIFMSRFSRDLQYKRATSFTEVSYLKTIFMSGRWFRPIFHVEISWDL